jgi:hypothetical protein
MFGPPKHKKYADIVAITSVDEAKRSSSRLMEEYKASATKSKCTLIRQVVNNASNRAMAASKKKTISVATRERLVAVSKIYRNLFDALKKMESTCG